MYLDYGEYEEMGGTLSEEQFALLELRAGNLIDQMTHGRLKREEGVRESVRHAVYHVVCAMAEDDAHGGRAVQSLTNDGVSIRYALFPAQLRYMRIVRECLLGEKTSASVGLLYAGVDA